MTHDRPWGRRKGPAAALMLALVLVPRLAAADPVPASASAKPAGQSGGPLFGTALFDKKKPIEITSDRLDVDQDSKTAIFEGKVDAIQGTVRLRADRLKVYYDTVDAAGGAPPAPGGTGAAPPAQATASAASSPDDPAASGGKIRRMDVDGHVFVTSPTETASGSNGVYNADTGKITLLGDVILTRGDNVIRGTRVSIDVDSGRSVIDSKSSADGGRVKGLFVPKKDAGPGTPAPAKATQPQ